MYDLDSIRRLNSQAEANQLAKLGWKVKARGGYVWVDGPNEYYAAFDTLDRDKLESFILNFQGPPRICELIADYANAFLPNDSSVGQRIRFSTGNWQDLVAA